MSTRQGQPKQANAYSLTERQQGAPLLQQTQPMESFLDTLFFRPRSGLQGTAPVRHLQRMTSAKDSQLIIAAASGQPQAL